MAKKRSEIEEQLRLKLETAYGRRMDAWAVINRLIDNKHDTTDICYLGEKCEEFRKSDTYIIVRGIVDKFIKHTLTVGKIGNTDAAEQLGIIRGANAILNEVEAFETAKNELLNKAKQEEINNGNEDINVINVESNGGEE